MLKHMLMMVGLTAGLAAAGLPALAQEAPKLRPEKSASLRLDFGAGRKLDVDCGATPLAECMALITPLADKVAATEPVGPQMMRLRHERPRPPHYGPEGREHKGPKEPPAPPAEAPPTP